MAIRLLMLSIFVSVTCYENAVSQTPELECKIPDHSFVNRSMNVHVDLSEREFELLQIEGHCFLTCAALDRYSKLNEVN